MMVRDGNSVREATDAEMREVDPLTFWRAECVVSAFQAKAAMAQTEVSEGVSVYDAVEAHIASADTVTRLAWASAVTWSRQSPTIVAIAAALGMTDEALDALFLAAEQISV